jgi:hypothetical protein
VSKAVYLQVVTEIPQSAVVREYPPLTVDLAARALLNVELLRLAEGRLGLSVTA